MKNLTSAFVIVCLISTSAFAQPNNTFKYKNLVYEQSMHGMFFRDGKHFFTIDCNLKKVEKEKDATLFIFHRTGTSSINKKRFTSIDIITIRNQTFEYAPNFFNLDTIVVNDYGYMGNEKKANVKEEKDMNFFATTTVGDNQKFQLDLRENVVLPSYFVEMVEKTKMRHTAIGYTTTTGGMPSNAIGTGTPRGPNRTTFQTDLGTYIREDMDQISGRIVNRTVKNKETVTTKAGTFNCWVIKGESEKHKKMTVVDFFSPEVGIVKREYKMSGKVTQTLTLSKAI